MKKIVLTFAAISIFNIGYSQNSIRVHKTDGTKLELPLHGIDSITYFTAADVKPASSVVVNWNQITVNATKKAGNNTNIATRIIAAEAIAVYDAINSIKNFGTPYHFYEPSASVASPRAAAAQAAHDVLVNFYPAQKAYLDSALDISVNSVSEAGIEAGREVGRKSAADIISLRLSDGSLPDIGYAGPELITVGGWRPTPAAFGKGINYQWKTLKPFVLVSPEQFRAPAPPVFGSPEFLAAVSEVSAIGSIASTSRNEAQTHIAHFYKQDAELVVNEAARILVSQYDKSLEESALIFLLTDVAEADARIAVWDSKYFYNYWRPVTALNAEADGTVANNYATWSPLLPTPAHPSYPSGHSATISAGIAVLKNFFGDANSLTIKTTTAGEAARSFSSLTTIEVENGISRIYGGIHYSFDNIAGQDLGKKVAQYVVKYGPSLKK